MFLVSVVVWVLVWEGFSTDLIVLCEFSCLGVSFGFLMWLRFVLFAGVWILILVFSGIYGDLRSWPWCLGLV